MSFEKLINDSIQQTLKRHFGESCELAKGKQPNTKPYVKKPNCKKGKSAPPGYGGTNIAHANAPAAMEEMSMMGNGSVDGGGFQKMDREEFIKEIMLREEIENIFSKILNENHSLQYVMKKLILEKTGKIHDNTGLNAVEQFLRRVIESYREAYSFLTTDRHQRDSFVKHLISILKHDLGIIVQSKFSEEEPIYKELMEILDIKAPTLYKDLPAENIEATEEDMITTSTPGARHTNVDVEEISIPDPDAIPRSKFGDVSLPDPNKSISSSFGLNEGTDVTIDGREIMDIEKNSKEIADEEEKEKISIEGEDSTGRNHAVKIYDELFKTNLRRYLDLLENDSDIKTFIVKVLEQVELYAEKFESELHGKFIGKEDTVDINTEEDIPEELTDISVEEELPNEIDSVSNAEEKELDASDFEI